MMSDANSAAPWRRFAVTLAVATLALTALLYGFIVALDPFGLRASAARGATPMMDVNQRFMYPQIVRSGRFDSAIFGTSTSRLLDPSRLDEALGGRFANLAMNAATPWEQLQLATLFLRSARPARTIIFGLDVTWCDAEADRKTLTFRTFPPWLYDDDPLNDYPELLNLTTLEIAGRVALHRLGLMRERIPPNGYENFLPDEALYDLQRARHNIALMAQISEPHSIRADSARAVRQVDAPFPALSWLDSLLSGLGPDTRVVLAFMPVHASLLPPAGSTGEQRESACKARVAELGALHKAVAVDFRLRSPVTTKDSNYWDGLHYRVGIASRIGSALANAIKTGGDGPDGFYRVLSPRPH